MLQLNGLLGSATQDRVRGRDKVATISPTMSRNILTFRDCYTDPDACVDRTGPANLVYMRSQPQADASGPAQPKLSYKMLAGQKYVTAGLVPTDYFYDITYNYSMPHDHEIFRGEDQYYQVWYNQRVMYIKASDVLVN